MSTGMVHPIWRSGAALCAAIIALPVAAFGQAECLSGADLAQGIVVTLDNGAIEVYRRDVDDSALVNVEGSGESGPAYRLLLAQGILVLSFESIAETGSAMSVTTTYAYPVTPQDVPQPSPGSDWAVAAVRYDSEGEHLEDQTWQADALATLTIGECSYALIPVTVAYGSDYTEEISYLPDLGFGFLHWYQNRGGEKIMTNLISLARAE